MFRVQYEDVHPRGHHNVAPPPHWVSPEAVEVPYDSEGLLFQTASGAELAARLMQCGTALRTRSFRAVLQVDIRVSDCFLEDADWAVHRLSYVRTVSQGREAWVCRQATTLQREGYHYELAAWLGTDLEHLRKWHSEDFTGSTGEPTHDVGWLSGTGAERKFRHAEIADEEQLWGPYSWCDSCGRDVRDCDTPEHVAERAAEFERNMAALKVMQEGLQG